MVSAALAEQHMAEQHMAEQQMTERRAVLSDKQKP
jgi:hypothetical protein